MHIVGLCPNGDKDASNHSGDRTPYARVRNHVDDVVTKHRPGINVTNTNCRQNCRKCGEFCAKLTLDEVHAASERIKSQIAPGDIIISLGGAQSNRVVKQVASDLQLSDAQYFVGGKHASTHVVRYHQSWGSIEAQLAACIGSATSLSKFLYEAGLSADQSSLFDALANDGDVAYVQRGENAVALERATAMDKAAAWQRGKASFQNKTGIFATKDGVENAGCVGGGKTTFQKQTGQFATRDGVENAGCVDGGKNSHGSCTKLGKGVGKHSAPKTTTGQTQANFEVFQRNHPDKLPEIARVEGFHYLKLRQLGFQFMNASGKTKARVTKVQRRSA
eukprot:SAG31_NODE_2897_length_4936_cov_3.814348_1_plen_334_part_00